MSIIRSFLEIKFYEMKLKIRQWRVDILWYGQAKQWIMFKDTLELLPSKKFKIIVSLVVATHQKALYQNLLYANVVVMTYNLRKAYYSLKFPYDFQASFSSAFAQ